ncbi:Subtilisin-like protease 3 [Pseudogymnoascus australis]
MLFSKSLVALAACFLPLIVSAELKLRNAAATNVAADSYIVVYNDIDDSTFEAEMFNVNSFLSKRDSTFRGLGHKYKMSNFKGYQIEADMDTVDRLSQSPHVAYVDKDVKVSAYDLSVRIGAPWGLDRLSHRNGTSPGLEEYTYDSSAGKGTTIYIIDTGIHVNHVEFEGRAKWGTNFIAGSVNDDEDGHGTHVAAVAAGKTFGVASKANLVAVRVLDAKGDGKSSDVLAGMQWAANAAEYKNQTGKSVINMSLGAAYSEAFNKATAAIVARGVVVVAAAGNTDINASTVSPASAPEVITVGATYRNDSRAYFSNWGAALDVFAPGVNILSAWIGNNTATKTISGTSMACPHVAGIAAYFIGLENNGSSTPAKIAAKIKKVSTKGVVGDLKNSVNNLAYNDNGY